MSAKSLSRRQFLKLAAGLGGAAALAACAPSPAPAPAAEPAKPAEPTKPAAAPAPAGKVELTVAHAWEAAFMPHQEAWDKTLMAKYPNITIKNINSAWAEHNRIVPTWAAANQLPDIIYVHGSRAFPWNREGIMVPIDAYLQSDKEFDVNGIWAEALRLYQYNGKQYELPYDHGPIILGYNKDLFDKAGLKYPDENWTWDDFLVAAQKLTDPKKPQWGYGGYYGGIVSLGNEIGIALVGPWGGKVFSDDEKKLLLDTPETKTALQFFADLIHKHKAAPKSAESQSFPQGAWVAGVTGMFAVATWGTPTLIQFANFKWDVAPWPKGPKGRKTGSFGSGYGITRDSKNKDAAWKYLREYLSKEGMEFMWASSGRGSPARKAAYPAYLKSPGAPEHAQYFLEALDQYAETGHPYKTSAAAEVADVFSRHTQLVETGEKTVEQAIADIIKEAQPLLDKAVTG